LTLLIAIFGDQKSKEHTSSNELNYDYNRSQHRNVSTRLQ